MPAMRTGSVRGVSVSTQADIQHLTYSYDSEDENAGRRKIRMTAEDKSDRRIPTYSKEEFREQYCISNKQLDLLDSKKDRFLGCLSQYHIDSPCSRTSRSSFLSVCVRRRVPSDENLNTDYAPLPRYTRQGRPVPPPPDLYQYENELEGSYFRRRPRSVCSQPDPKRYSWMPEDEDFQRIEWPAAIPSDLWTNGYSLNQMGLIGRGGSLPRSNMPCPAHSQLPPPPPPPALPHITPHRPKHVSFARSHTLTTFDSEKISLATRPQRPILASERLLPAGITAETMQNAYGPIMFQPSIGMFPPPPAPVHYPQQQQQVIPLAEPPTKVVVLDNIKKGVMRTQATQTEVCLGRKPLPPNYLSLSPRTIKRVKMVAAGVQTNGYCNGNRRLTKSFSEMGGERFADDTIGFNVSSQLEHEKLHRTQSEEPPRSPRSPLLSPSCTQSLSNEVSPRTPPSSQLFFTDPNTHPNIDPITTPYTNQEHNQPIRTDFIQSHPPNQPITRDYFQQNFQFIHESDRDDTIDDDDDVISGSILNSRNLDYLQRKIEEAKALASTSGSEKTFSKLTSGNSTETSVTTTDDSDRNNEREIIIDFEPCPDGDASLLFGNIPRRQLIKTMSEGEMLLDVRKTELQSNSDCKDASFFMSTSHENMTKEENERERKYEKYAREHSPHTPIKDEGIFGLKPDESFSSSDGTNGIYEDFHERYISYKHEAFRHRSVSLDESSEYGREETIDLGEVKSNPTSPNASQVDPLIVGKRSNIKTSLQLDRLSPFASCDSLSADNNRDHSDGNWNESQATVLQLDSGAENGTMISSSDISNSLGTSLNLLTPSSRRKHLLMMQHQQRSSMDTDALDDEGSQSPTSPRQHQRKPISPPSLPPITSQPAKSFQPILKITTNIQREALVEPPKEKANTSREGIRKTPNTQIKQVNVQKAPAIAITHPSLDLTELPLKRTPSVITKKRERALSPSRRRDLQKTSGAPENKTVPKTDDETQMRTDSGKTNTTDASESTTTDDYVTATDSSKINSNQAPDPSKPQEGSSFESASSLYSRPEVLAEDLIVPSYSPPLKLSEDFSVPELPKRREPEVLKEIQKDDNQEKHIKSSESKDGSSGKSSSTGSYSVTNSANHTPEANKVAIAKCIKDADESLKGSKSSGKEDESRQSGRVVRISSDFKDDDTEKSSPTKRKKHSKLHKPKGSLSDDERSGHYSSSGYYESPLEDDDDDGGLTYKHSTKYRNSNRPWSVEEKRRKKKTFTLEFSKSYDDSVSTSQDDWSKQSSKENNERVSVRTKAKEERVTKTTRFKEHNKTPLSSPRSSVDIEKIIKDKSSEVKRTERIVKRTKFKSKSPTKFDSGRDIQRRSNGDGIKLHLNVITSDDSSEHYKKNREGICNNGNMSPRKHRRVRESPRRKTNSSCANTKSPSGSHCHSTMHRTKKKISSSTEKLPDCISLPGSLPRRKQREEEARTEEIEEGSRLTPQRYITTPPSHRHTTNKNKQIRFGKAVSAESLRSVSPGSDSVFYHEDSRAHCTTCGKELQIVTADESNEETTPEIVPAPAGFADSPAASLSSSGQRSKSMSGVRLYKKLEKRFRSEDKARRHRHRHEIRAKSEERGKEEYAANKRKDENEKWIARSAGPSLDKITGGSSISIDPEDEVQCSGSSDDERGVYAVPWWCGNWILLPTWHDNPEDRPRLHPERLSSDATESEIEFVKRYIALSHRLVHRRACIDMFRRQGDDDFKSDKTVVVRRGDGEFGFRIHGSKPVVVSAIEPDTPAETSGLEVGDIVIAVNGINVLDKSHSEVVKIAHAGSEVLELEVARTCDVVASLASESNSVALFAGYLWRAVPANNAQGYRWTRRWFALKRDNCLYYYKTDSSVHPVGALMLINYTLSDEDIGKPHGFRLQRGGGTRLQLAGDSAEAAARWRAVLSHAIEESSKRGGWLDSSVRFMKLPPSSITHPDCFGYLTKLGSKWKSWSKRYCVLKDACVYFFQDGNSKQAFGMICLHGYRICSSTIGGKKFAFEAAPTEPQRRHFYFYTESEMDKRRWMAALEYSIDRWMKAG